MSDVTAEFSVRAVGRGLEPGNQQPATPGPEHERLNAFVGRWINQGHTIGVEPEAKIVVSDVYEWMPGSFFVLHTAYGTIGTFGVGGTEIMGWDDEEGSYLTWLFDNAGNVTQHRLTYDDGTWKWQGKTTRCTATFSVDGRIQTAHHERTDDGETWAPSMDVTLTRVD